MSAETEALRIARVRAIEKFLDDNAGVFGVTATDDVGDGPFVLTDDD